MPLLENWLRAVLTGRYSHLSWICGKAVFYQCSPGRLTTLCTNTNISPLPLSHAILPSPLLPTPSSCSGLRTRACTSNLLSLVAVAHSPLAARLKGKGWRGCAPKSLKATGLGIYNQFNSKSDWSSWIIQPTERCLEQQEWVEDR